jgi:hypothetical protein
MSIMEIRLFMPPLIPPLPLTSTRKLLSKPEGRNYGWRLKINLNFIGLRDEVTCKFTKCRN